MTLFNRNLITELNRWKSRDGRKPLILRGARQVGKTTTVNLFAADFDQYLYFNLEKKEDKEQFEHDLTFNKLIESLFFLKGKSRNGGTTLLFIDEIQNVPKAINLLRYFYEEAPDLFVIAAGSLLETILDEKVNVPVGRVEYRVTRPVSFSEFLGAMGEEPALKQFFKIPMDEFAHSKLITLFHTYAMIGGMPEVVANYIAHRDLILLQPIYESLLVSYLDDVEKYARNVSLTQVMRHAIKSSFSEAGLRIKFQNFGKSNYSSREMGEALRTLEKAMLLHLVYPTVNTIQPIAPDFRKSPRMQVLDTGMMNHFAGIQKELTLALDLQVVYKGKMIEHLVGQEILASHFNVLHQLSFWVREKKDSVAEVDYLINVDGNLVPIEVKSGATGTLKSLHSFMELAPHDLAVRFYGGPIKWDDLKTANGKKFTLLNLPFYLAGHVEAYVRWMANGFK
jgi:uncharacterized protein